MIGAISPSDFGTPRGTLVLFLVCLLALFACGSSDDSTTQTSDGSAPGSGGASSGSGGSKAGTGGSASGTGGSTGCPKGEMYCVSGCNGVGHCAPECAITDVFCPPMDDAASRVDDAGADRSTNEASAD